MYQSDEMLIKNEEALRLSSVLDMLQIDSFVMGQP
jgi:hypothetical protein